jgi:DNA invertase Pin-like site-specific DNA recombinase
LKTYFGYVRVSTPRQGERGVSLQEQRDAIMRHAARFSLNVCEWFEEQQTAAKKGRPIWNRMLKFLRSGKAEGVIIHKIDRSARNLKDWADLGDLIDQGIDVHFANESLDLQSRGGRLSADIQAVVAADYIRNLREEAKKGIYGRLKQGFYPMRAPVGYADHGAGKPKTIDPVKGPLVRTAFELYASGRFTILTLGDELYRRGLRNHAGRRVTRNGISTILNNSFYMGIIKIQRTGENFLGNHEPLVTKRLFETVQNVLNGRYATRTKAHDFLFRRILTCRLCSYSLIGELQKGHIYYRCHTEDCPTKGVREESVVNCIEESLARLNFTQAERAYLRNATESLKCQWIEEKARQVSALTVAGQHVAQRLSRLTDAYLDQAVERDLFEARKKELLFERRSLDDQKAFLEHDPEGVPAKLQKFLELAGAAHSLFRMANPAKKRRLLKITSSNLTLDQKTLCFSYAPPFQAIAARSTDHDGRPSKGWARTLDALIASLTQQSEACAAITAALGDGSED